MRCPCGCGADLNINVDARIDPHWRLIRKDCKLTLIPSVWRESDCGAHFVLWENEIIMCGTGRIRHARPFMTEKAIRDFLGGSKS
jgi:hypothetical protein